MSKKRRKKLEKIANDETLNEKEKKAILDQIKQDGMGEKRVKRSKMGDFKNQSTYITTERPIDMDGVKSSSLWNEDERAYLEDVTLNLVNDDD